MRLPDESVTVSTDGRRLSIDAHDVQVLDEAPAPDAAATVSFQIDWKGGGRRRQRGLPTSDPAGPSAFDAQMFARTRATATFSGLVNAFTFTTTRRAHAVWAELGTERNGTFLTPAARCAACATSPTESKWR